MIGYIYFNGSKCFKDILKRPHIEYCTQAWAPVSRDRNWNAILRLESIQRSVTKIKKSKRLQLQGEIREIRINYFIRKKNEK